MDGCGIVNSIWVYLQEKKRILFLWGYLSAICVAEIIIKIISPYTGVLMHIVILFSLYIHAAFYHKYDIRKLYLALNLGPLIRIISLAMPIYQLPNIYWYTLIGIPMLAATVLVIRITDLKPIEIGLRVGSLPLQVIIGCCLGVPLGLLNYTIQKPQPLIEILDFPSLIIPAIISLVYMGFLEELIFRGILYKVSVETVSPKFGLFYTSIVYTSLHIPYLSVVNILFVFCAALAFNLLVKRFNSLLVTSLAHGTANIVLYLIWPFLFHNEVEVKMISIVHPLMKTFALDSYVGELSGMGLIVTILLIILLAIKEVAGTVIEYSPSHEFTMTGSLSRSLNICIIPLLYIFVFTVLSKIEKALNY